MSPALAAAARLRASLGAIINALVSSDIDGLLAAETSLASALQGLRNVSHVDPAERDAICSAVAQARADLARCRAVGTALGGVIDGCLGARGLSQGYDRSGAITLRRPGTAKRVRV
jgi:hypothetical protein